MAQETRLDEALKAYVRASVDSDRVTQVIMPIENYNEILKAARAWSTLMREAYGTSIKDRALTPIESAFIKACVQYNTPQEGKDD